MASKRPTSEPKLVQKVPCAGRTEGRVFSVLTVEHVCVVGSAAQYVVTLRRATVPQFQDLWPAQEVWTKLLHVPNLSEVNKISNTRKAAGRCGVRLHEPVQFRENARSASSTILWFSKRDHTYPCRRRTVVSWPKATGRHRPVGLTASRHSCPGAAISKHVAGLPASLVVRRGNKAGKQAAAALLLKSGGHL